MRASRVKVDVLMENGDDMVAILEETPMCQQDLQPGRLRYRRVCESSNESRNVVVKIYRT
jgi:hypothetical protein